MKKIGGNSGLQKERENYQPQLPTILENLDQLVFEGREPTEAISNQDEIHKLFPRTYGQPKLTLKKGSFKIKPLKVGVVLSGGQAAGGHNVITGLFDALKKLDSNSQLFGFIGGPSGIVDQTVIELTQEDLKPYRNQGGFDLIGSGRTKIETEEQLEKSLQTMRELHLDGLVVIGGDDSNTNAAVLAEYFRSHDCSTCVVGVPKTIDGDLKNEDLEISFGFDTACKTYSEMIGNLARDALSAKKYTHFIKLMGRSASHIALECALATHPNFTILSEEVTGRKSTLSEIVTALTDVIEKRSKANKSYGIVLIPEGVIEFIPEMRTLIQELNQLLAQSSPEEVPGKLSEASRQTLQALPKDLQKQLLLDRDPHGNVQVSHIETEKLFIELVKVELKKRNFQGKFTPLNHFLGYEGRAGFPSNFDANYCYALGHVAALLLSQHKTGYMSVIRHLTRPPKEWEAAGIPITSLMNLEERKGKKKPVIRKALVDLKGHPCQKYFSERAKWAEEDCYLFPGPIQFAGPPEVTDTYPITLQK